MTAPKNPAPLGLPLTISTAEVVRNMGLNDKPEVSTNGQSSTGAPKRGMVSTASLRPAEAAPFGRQPSADAPATTKAEREAAQRHASYMVGDTTPSKVDLSRKDIPGPMLLEVTQIDPYDGNPRQFENEAIEDIRTSIVAHGFTDAMVVTRRREGDRFMLAAGSNTTLKLLKELYASTSDEKYRYVNCIFQPFESEARVLAQHLGENLNRGGMKFWEIAAGMTELLDLVGKERGRALSAREQVAALQERGLRAQHTDVAFWAFAVQRLDALGAAKRQLTRECVRAHLQPRLNALQRLAGKFKVDDDSYWDRLVSPQLAAAASNAEGASSEAQLDGDALCRSVESAFAEHVSESLAGVQRMLAMLKLSPELTLADLRLPVGSAPGALSAAAASATDARLAQAPLPLTPGLVRSSAATAADPASGSPPAAQSDARDSPSVGRTPAWPQTSAAAETPTQTEPSTQGPLFSGAVDSDPLASVIAAVRDLLALAGLSDTLRLRDEMPLGFFVELPDRQMHARRAVTLGSPEHQARTTKTHVWWALVLMTGQYREGSVPYMDRASGFYRFAAGDIEGPSPLDGTDIEETADLEDLLMLRMSPGAVRPVMRQLARVEELAATLFAAAPERWRRMLEVNRPRA